MAGNSETSPPPPRFKLTWQFAAGFLGWFLVNGGLWLLLLDRSEFNSEEGSILTNGMCVFPLNLAIMAFLLWKKETRQTGQGILAAYAVNFAISLVLGLGTNAVCLVPFFN